MAAPKELLALVERFNANREAYLSGKYNETQLRREFVDPLFKLLGWDVWNEQGWAEAYKDVVHEDAIKVGAWTKAPDYAFRIGGVRKFFVETKKPAKDLKQDPEPAFQLRRYAWSAKLPLSILTDFEEFAVYDTRVKPVKTDKPSVARVMYLRYTEYADRWDEIAGIFSREAVLKGSFDRYVESKKKKRGTAEVDEAFLTEIERWREELARNLALRNPDLDLRALNTAVQRTIDRVVFLRICEDRGIEPYGQLQGLLNGERVYARLGELFLRADDRYNSGLFHFSAERGRKEPRDEFTLSLTIDDKVLKAIIGHLYYPESPYELSVLAADILGQVYEQFLGKVIRLTPGHRAKVEDKPEVRKAGGVYYTPTYIVDYIVEHTVGRLLEEAKTPNRAAGLRILDPACGSGSFLVGAYQKLLDWHRHWYIEDGAEKYTKGRNPKLYQGPGGEWRLTTAEKKRILTNNIFGVDVDAQAVEVTKLSLLLKVLEGESAETLETQFRLFRERALPDLASNIKCGNSLVRSDFYEDKQIDMLDEEERYRINVFDWEDEFPEILGRENPGFDAVIGNPPYVLLQFLDQPEVFQYFRERYRSARYKIDTYHLFWERAVILARDGGWFGYISPSSFLRNKHAFALRELLLESSEIAVLRLFSYPVFPASVDTCVMIARRSGRPNQRHEVTITSSLNPAHIHRARKQALSLWQEHDLKEFGVDASGESGRLVSKIDKSTTQLGEFATAYFGIQTYDRRRFVSKSRDSQNFRPVIDGEHIARYSLQPGSEYVDFSPRAMKSGGKEVVYEQDRIGVRQIGGVPIATLLPAGLYTLNTIYNVYFTKPTPHDLRFILGIMCSRLVQYYWRVKFFDQKRTFPKIKKGPLLSLPIPRLNWSDDHDRGEQDRLVEMVQKMLELKTQLAGAKTSHARSVIERPIAALDRQIDQLVYELYGLTDEEIRIVDEATRP